MISFTRVYLNMTLQAKKSFDNNDLIELLSKALWISIIITKLDYNTEKLSFTSNCKIWHIWVRISIDVYVLKCYVMFGWTFQIKQIYFETYFESEFSLSVKKYRRTNLFWSLVPWNNCRLKKIFILLFQDLFSHLDSY